MVLFIIVCIIAWGVCRFKKVDFLSTLFIGFLIGIASIFISGFIGLCTASLTQTEVKTETYKNVNYYISHGKLSAYSKENVYITAETEDDSYTDFSIVKGRSNKWNICYRNKDNFEKYGAEVNM